MGAVDGCELQVLFAGPHKTCSIWEIMWRSLVFGLWIGYILIRKVLILRRCDISLKTSELRFGHVAGLQAAIRTIDIVGLIGYFSRFWALGEVQQLLHLLYMGL